MDIAKFVFEAIDVAFNRKQNKSMEIEGAEDVVVTKDVLYSDVDIKMCLLDYHYMPKKKGPYPVIFNIHGGGFMAGGKEYRRALCDWFATDGFMVINVNYGLCPNCKFPTPLLHLTSALNWVTKNARRLNLDLGNVAVYGDSAGGYYAAMLAAICTNEKLQKVFKVKPKIKFKAAILNCGLYDIDHTLKRRIVLDLNKKVFSSYTGIDEENFNDYKYKDYLSPLEYINADFPPTFIIYAQKDIFCGGQADFLIKKLEEFDIYYESYHTNSIKRNHCFSLEWTSPEARDANRLIRKFTEKMTDGTLPAKMSAAPYKIREHEII